MIHHSKNLKIFNDSFKLHNKVEIQLILSEPYVFNEVTNIKMKLSLSRIYQLSNLYITKIHLNFLYNLKI